MYLSLNLEVLKHTFVFSIGAEVVPEVSGMDLELLKAAKAQMNRQQAANRKAHEDNTMDPNDSVDKNQQRVVGFVPNPAEDDY